MNIKKIFITLFFISLTGCFSETKEAHFDLSKVNCNQLTSIENPEDKAKAIQHCNTLKATESRFEKSKDKKISIR